MTDRIKRFETTILRPTWLFFVLAALYFAVNTMWWWGVGCVLAVFYIGTIGSKLHPLQSATELAKGPTTGPAANAEADLLPDGVQAHLVGHACTRLGIVIGISVGVAIWGLLGWHWYWALLLGWFTLSFGGGLLKFLFVLREN